MEGCESKSALPKDFATGILETASTDIYNTTRWGCPHTRGITQSFSKNIRGIVIKINFVGKEAKLLMWMILLCKPEEYSV